MALTTETFIEQLEQIGLAITNLQGQSYDNQSNMKDKDKGVQNRVLQINPCAFFVPCNSHSLNLVVNDAAMYCLEAISLFGWFNRCIIIFRHQHTGGKSYLVT